MATTEDTARGQTDRGQTAPSGTPPEFLAWAESHQRQERRHEAELAQISRHSQGTEQRSALEEEETWVQEHEHERRLHDSALAQLRHPRPEGDPAGQGS